MEWERRLWAKGSVVNKLSTTDICPAFFSSIQTFGGVRKYNLDLGGGKGFVFVATNPYIFSHAFG
jgi:hypothetical protein